MAQRSTLTQEEKKQRISSQFPKDTALDKFVDWVVKQGGDVATVLGQMAQAAGSGIAGGAQSMSTGIGNAVNQLFGETDPLHQKISEVRGKITGAEGQQGTGQQAAPQQQQDWGHPLGTGGWLPRRGGQTEGQPAGQTAMTGSQEQRQGGQTMLTGSQGGEQRVEPTVSPSGVRTYESRAINQVITSQNVSSLDGEQALQVLVEMDPAHAREYQSAMERSPADKDRILADARRRLMSRFGAME